MTTSSTIGPSLQKEVYVLNLTETIKDLRIISPEYFWKIWHHLALGLAEDYDS